MAQPTTQAMYGTSNTACLSGHWSRQPVPKVSTIGMLVLYMPCSISSARSCACFENSGLQRFGTLTRRRTVSVAPIVLTFDLNHFRSTSSCRSCPGCRHPGSDDGAMPSARPRSLPCQFHADPLMPESCSCLQYTVTVIRTA